MSEAPNPNNGNYPDEVVNQVLDLARRTEVFADPSEPVLGQTDDVVMAENLEQLIRQPDTIITTLNEDEQMVGFTLAVPIGVMDPTRAAESNDTAYIYYTAIEPERIGEGKVEPLMAATVERLRDDGYSFLERDSQISNGYADKIQKTYQDAIVSSRDHLDFPEFGPLRFFRIDLNAID